MQARRAGRSYGKTEQSHLITVRMQAAAGQTLVLETYLSFRLRMTLSDGQCDDRTFWLLVREP